MNCKKYRAVLLGVIVMALVVGVCFYTKMRYRQMAYWYMTV